MPSTPVYGHGMCCLPVVVIDYLCSYQHLCYPIRGTETEEIMAFLADIRPIAKKLSDVLRKIAPDYYAELEPMMKAVPEEYRYAT